MPFRSYTFGVQWHIVLDRVPDTQGKGRYGSSPSQSMQLHIAAATWWIETKRDSAFSQITLDLLFISNA